MKLPAFDRSNSAAPTNSSGLPKLRHGRLLHDAGGTCRVENLAILLGRKKAGAQRVHAHAVGANSRATLRVRFTTAAFEAE